MLQNIYNDVYKLDDVGHQISYKSLRMKEFLCKYVVFEESTWPKFSRAINEVDFESIDIIGSSLHGSSETCFSPLDLDSVVMLASSSQMINIDLPHCSFYPRKVRERLTTLTKRSKMEVVLDNGETKPVYQCPSKLILVADWSSIGRIQVFLVSTGTLPISDCLRKVEEAMCFAKRFSKHSLDADVPSEVEMYDYATDIYENVPVNFLKDVFRRLSEVHKDSEFCFYIAGHDLKKTQSLRETLPSIDAYVHGPVLNSKLDVGFNIHSISSSGDALATFLDPTNLVDCLERVASKSHFEWESYERYTLLGTRDLIGMVANSSDSNFIKLKLYATTLERMTTDPHGVMLHKFKFNMDKELGRNEIAKKFLEEYKNEKECSFNDDHFLDCFLSNIYKSISQPWYYRAELSVKMEGLEMGVEHLRYLAEELNSQLIVLKTNWVSLLTATQIESYRLLGKSIIDNCQHGFSNKANSLSIVNEVMRNHITGCRPSTKRFSRQLRLIGFFESIKLRNIPSLPDSCHFNTEFFPDESFFLGIKTLVGKLVKPAHKVELACLVIFLDALNGVKEFSRKEVVSMIGLQYCAWSFSRLRKGHVVNKNVQFAYGPFLKLPKSLENFPKFSFKNSSRWITSLPKLPKKTIAVSCLDFLEEEFFVPKNRTYQALMNFVMNKYKIDKMQMVGLLKKFFLSQDSWRYFVIPDSKNNHFKLKYKLGSTILHKITFTELRSTSEPSETRLNRSGYPKSLCHGKTFPFDDLNGKEAEAVWNFANGKKKKPDFIIEYEKIYSHKKIPWTDEEIAILFLALPNFNESGQDEKNDYRRLYKSILGGFVRRNGPKLVVRRLISEIRNEKTKLKSPWTKYAQLMRQYARNNEVQLRRAIFNYAFYGSQYENSNLSINRPRKYKNDSMQDRKNITRRKNPLWDYLNEKGYKDISADVLTAINVFGGKSTESFRVEESEVIPDVEFSSIFKDDFSFIYIGANVLFGSSTFKDRVCFSEEESTDTTDKIANPDLLSNVSFAKDIDNVEEIETTSVIESQFSDYYIEKGLREWFKTRPLVLNVPPDGHCGFHAYGLGLRTTGPLHLRRKMLEEIERHSEFYSNPFCVGIERTSIDWLKDNLRCFKSTTSSKWFNNRVAHVLANMARRPVVLFSILEWSLTQLQAGKNKVDGSTYIPLREKTFEDPESSFEPIMALLKDNHFYYLEGELERIPNTVTVKVRDRRGTVIMHLPPAREFYEYHEQHKYRPPLDALDTTEPEMLL